MPIERRRVVYLSPQDDAHAALLAAACAAKRSLHLMIYGFTLADLGEVLVAKQTAGLAVGVVVDKTQAAGPTQHTLLQHLVDAGVPITITTSHGAIMHEKVLLADLCDGPEANNSFVAFGSYNFSSSAQKQANVLITENDPVLCRYFWGQYQALEEYGAAHCTQLRPSAQAPASPSAGSASHAP